VHSNWCIDWYSGTQITFGILAALHWRRKTGLGTMIEFSQVQAATRCLEYRAAVRPFGIVRQRWGNWDTQLCVHGIILTGKSDLPGRHQPAGSPGARYVMVSAFQDADFKALCDVIKKPDHVQQVHETQGSGGGPGPGGHLRPTGRLGRTRAAPKRCASCKRGRHLGAPVMNDREVYENEHYRQRGTVRWMDDPSSATFWSQGLQLPATCPRPRDGSTGSGGRWARTTSSSTTSWLGYPMSDDQRMVRQGLDLKGGEHCV
jgi:crotonobetainyl-CoA:carnitine CoA-transferase CaiB-like acyl-CoA transferase